MLFLSVLPRLAVGCLLAFVFSLTRLRAMGTADLPPEPAVTPTLEIGANVSVGEPQAVYLSGTKETWALVDADVKEEEADGLPQGVFSRDQQSAEFLVE